MTAIILSFILGTIVCAFLFFWIQIKKDERIKQLEIECEKQKLFYEVLLKWLKTRRIGESIASYLKKRKYNSVAIYGMKEIGVELLNELEECGVRVEYAIDKNASNIYEPIDIYTMEEELPQVDVIIVTAVYYYDGIKKEMAKKVECPVVSILEILNGCDDRKVS